MPLLPSCLGWKGVACPLPLMRMCMHLCLNLLHCCCYATSLQPEDAAAIWNLRGVNCNSWHRVGVTVE